MSVRWYSANAGRSQGLVIDEETGRNIAVVYDRKNAKLLAQAPSMRELLLDLEQSGVRAQLLPSQRMHLDEILQEVRGATPDND